VAELGQDGPELKASTVAADTVDDFAISPVNVAEHGKPGYHLEPDAEGHMVNAVFRDADGKAKAAVLFPASSEVREFRRTSGQGDVGVIAYVDPAFRRQGVATKLYDKLRKGGYDIDELSGAHDLTPDGAAFVNSQRARKPGASEPRRPWIDPDVVKPDAPVRTETIKFDNPLDRDAQAQIESLIHDVKLMADENPDMRFELEDGSGEQSLADILADLEDDDKAIEAVKGCL
jgi:GNAT superfamily N-acetyltransferase